MLSLLGFRKTFERITKLKEYMMFPKERRRKKKKKHPKSIMHDKESGYCYLCALLNNDYTYKPREEHHVVFGSGQRESSEKYGLKVYLCPEHHRGGPYAPHNNKEIREMLCKIARERFEEEYTDLEWEEIFMKKYL